MKPLPYLAALDHAEAIVKYESPATAMETERILKRIGTLRVSMDVDPWPGRTSNDDVLRLTDPDKQAMWAVLLASHYGPYDLQAVFTSRNEAETFAARQRVELSSLKTEMYVWRSIRGLWWYGRRMKDVMSLGAVRITAQKITRIVAGQLRQPDPDEPTNDEIFKLLGCSVLVPEDGYMRQYDR